MKLLILNLIILFILYVITIDYIIIKYLQKKKTKFQAKLTSLFKNKKIDLKDFFPS